MGQKPQNALDKLVLKEDVLQICYWFQGEGFGDKFTAESVMPFLQTDTPTIDSVMKELVREGALDSDGESFFFNDGGKRKAGAMFYESFTEFQLGTHGECNAGCCDGDEVCDHDHH